MRFLLCCLVALALCGSAGRAAAHAVLLETLPADGARLDAPPSSIELRFNEPVVPVLVRLFDGHGQPADKSLRPRADDKSIVLELDRKLADGAWLVSWRVSSLDSHPIAGTLRFTVGEAGAAAPALPPAAEPAAGPLRWINLALRAAQYGLLLLAAGLALVLATLRLPAPLAGRLVRRTALVSGLALLASLLRLGGAGLEIAGLPPAALLTPQPWRLALGLPLGGATQAGAAGLGVLLVALLLPPARSVRPPVLLAGALLALLAMALTGHGRTIEPAWLGSALILVHAACAAFWLGGISSLRTALALVPAEAPLLLARFSKAAAALVNLLLIAGFALAWLLVGEPANLLLTAYGLKLSAKLLLVAGMLAIAALNLLVLTPLLERGEAGAASWLRRVLALDLVLVAAVVAMTASLELGPPPGAAGPAHHHAGHAPAPADWTTRLAARGYTVALRVTPARTGPSSAVMEIRDSADRPVDPLEATLLLSLPAIGIEPIPFAVEPAGPGRHTVPRLDFLRPGPWTARLDLLIDDFTRITLETEIPVE